jgi:Mn-dependent DtxR family transcriptional regulator
VDVLGQNYARRVKTLTIDQIATLTCKARKTILNALPKLKAEGLVEYASGIVKLTKKGKESLGELTNLGGTNEELQANLKKDLGKNEVRLFELLEDGETHDKDEIAKKLGYPDLKYKAFANLIGKMKNTRNLIVYPTPAKVALNKEVCFLPEGDAYTDDDGDD